VAWAYTCLTTLGPSAAGGAGRHLTVPSAAAAGDEPAMSEPAATMAAEAVAVARCRN
jgi:hypothetical protein